MHYKKFNRLSDIFIDSLLSTQYALAGKPPTEMQGKHQQYTYYLSATVRQAHHERYFIQPSIDALKGQRLLLIMKSGSQ
jgi:hypothetical protein